MSKLSERLKGYSIKSPQKDIKEILKERAAMQEPKKTLWQRFVGGVKGVLFSPLP